MGNTKKRQKSAMRPVSAALALLLHGALSYGQSANPTYSTYSGQPELTGTQSVRLLPGFHAPPGSTLRVFITTSLGNGASSSQNYIQTTRYLTPLDVPVDAPTTEQALRDITYYDGLGRPLQEVQVKASGGAGYKDLVTPMAYDGYGRQEYQYLPYATATGAGGTFKANAVTAQGSYYSGGSTVPAGQTPHAHAHSRTVFEPSPLNRVLEQGSPGAAWQPGARTATGGRTVATAYATNNATGFGTVATTRMVSRYGVTLNTSGVPTLTLNGTYPAGELYVTVTRDENWNGETTTFAGRLHSTEEYTDKQGRVVLRRAFNRNGTASELLSTYYVYNDLGQLSFVLTPELEPDRTGSTAPSAAELDNHAYHYRYDGRGRMSHRRIPGMGGWENYIYNASGLLVFHQDNRQQGESLPDFTPGPYHTFHKYDGLGRMIMKGVEKNRTMSYNAIVTSANTWPDQWEERSTASGNLHGYTNVSIPFDTEHLDVLEVNYYDRYDGIPDLPHNQSGSYSKLVHGRLVASKVKVLGTARYLWTVYYYDDRGNVVREWKQHLLGGTYAATEFDDILREYTFTGQLKKETRKHHTTSSTTPGVTVTTEYDYDHRDRLTHTWKRVNTGTRTLLAKNTYNEVGQLREKGLHSTDGGNAFGQTVRYGYNERGWLRSTNSELFRQELRYQDTASNRQFNGNISHQVFMRRGNTGSPPAWESDTYSYRYDGVNRLISGTMVDKGRETLTYDRNGNIRSLQRTDGDGALVDRLRYDYSGTGWGNRLKFVQDTVTTTTPTDPFQLPGTTDYTYDANGNMLTRKNTNTAVTHSRNNITGITYNYLNLPQQVTAAAGNVTYVYDAKGRKLRSINGANGQTRDYIDGIEYVGGVMELIHTEEGRITRSGSTYTYGYFLRDHLGNNRTGFAQGTNVTTPNFTADYYPFGLQYMQPIARAGSPKNNYLYNGKELQDGIGQYDYGARFYDPVIGRWGTVDPGSEYAYDWSPYNYAYNDPIAFVDEDGELPGPVGFVIGVASDYIMQAGTNYFIKGYTFKASLTSEINGWSLAVSGASGLLTGGVSSLTKVLTSNVGSRTLTKIIGGGADIFVGTVESVATDALSGGEIDVWKSVTGALLEMGIGKAVPSKYADKLEKKLMKKMDVSARNMDKYKKRLAEVHRNKSTRKRNTRKYEEASNNYDSYRNAYVGVKTVNDAFKAGGANVLNDLLLFQKTDNENQTKTSITVEEPIMNGVVK